jgi:YrbI family 3-deoxy-D-manno-octulosonate 8-phosphate phosphatase
MKIAALIPARGGSKSIPRKNVRPLGGRPLIHWALDAACGCPLIDKVFVATEDAEIAAVVAAHGHAKASVISRSAESATDVASTELVLLEFARQHEFEHVVLIQATSPLLRASDLTEGLSSYLGGEADSMLSVVRQKRFVWQPDTSGFFHPLNYHPGRRPRRQNFGGILVENGAFYVTRRDALLTSGCRISGRILCHEMPEETYLELDEPTDWEIVAGLLKHRHHPRHPASGGSIQLVLTDVDGVLTDAGMYYGVTGDSLKKFNTRDGMGMELLRQQGIEVGIITREQTEIVAQRARKLQLDLVIQGCRDKASALDQLLKERGLGAQNVAYIGDDINDLEIMGLVGFSAAPADAVEAVRQQAHYLCKTAGGHGCFREFAEEILQRETARRAATIPAPQRSDYQTAVSSESDIISMSRV